MDPPRFSGLYNLEDTIAAVTTASGPGGVAIVRISGPRALDIGLRLFSPTRTLKDGAPPPPRQMLHGHIVDPDGQEKLDEVLWVYFPSPGSYTTQDTVEIHGHGGSVASHLILEAALQQGCRLALPGEFTYRAYMGGRLELSQAEAVQELVSSQSKCEAQLALSVLDKGLSSKLQPVRRILLDCAAQVEVALDFPEDDFVWAPSESARELDDNVVSVLSDLLDKQQRLRLFQEGATVVLAGKPNVGKSSLFNVLLGQERAITHTTAGTTRDLLEEKIILGGVVCRLVDTAGLRFQGSDVEILGMEKTRKRLATCDLAVVLLDVSQPLDHEDFRILENTANISRLVVANKSDLEAAWTEEDLALDEQVYLTSVRNGSGLARLQQAIQHEITKGEPEPRGGEIVVSQRQALALLQCVSAVKSASQEMSNGFPRLEIVSLDLQTALECLGLVDGVQAPEQIIEEIFSRFCVGK